MNSDRIAVVDDDLYLSGIVKEYDDFSHFLMTEHRILMIS